MGFSEIPAVQTDDLHVLNTEILVCLHLTPAVYAEFHKDVQDYDEPVRVKV